MKKFCSAMNILLIEILGFIFVIVAIWIDELFHLPHYLFGEPMVPFLLREAIWESGFVGILGFVVIVATWRSYKRITQLESLLPICMICKKIRKPNTDPELDESWQTVEHYISDHTNSRFSHGLCPTCALHKYGTRLGPEQ